METIIVEKGNNWGDIVIMEKKMEATVLVVYWGYIGTMANKMEARGIYRGSVGFT